MHPFVRKVAGTIQKHALLAKGERVLVAVSGGADSMALLQALRELRTEFSLSLAVAHLDHGLRPDSGEDLAFVRQFAARLEIPFLGIRADVHAIKKKERLPLEEAAREARYAFFAQAAAQQKAHKVALGHTADDQAESVLMRFLRGSGSRGLAGIPAMRGGLFIRPLLEIWRREVEGYLLDRGIAYRQDPSNRSLAFLRNRIRLELLPVLEKYNPRVRRTMTNTAALFRMEEEFWRELVAREFPSVLKDRREGMVILDLPSLAGKPLPLRLRLYRQAIESLQGHLRRIALAHVQAMDDLLRCSAPNKTLKLPRGLRVAKAYREMILTGPGQEASPPFEYTVTGQGTVVIPEIGGGMVFSVQPWDNADRPSADPRVATLAFDEIDFPLQVRSFHPGDRFQPLGMEGEKKVKDFFMDRKIPLAERQRIPLLFKGERLLWVAGLRLDHRVRLHPATRKTLRVELLKG